jgi:beta-galactosidase
MNILLGADRSFIDTEGAWWQPGGQYQKGKWGFVGGRKFKLQNNTRLPYGTDKNIRGTNDDPVYQTQFTGIQQYRFDILPGKYQVSLHFAELMGGVVRVPPYNLNEDERKEELKQRIFNVSINGDKNLDHFNIAKDYGLAQAVVKTFTVVVTDDQGISIDFEPIEGEPVLNAIQLRKLSE